MRWHEDLDSWNRIVELTNPNYKMTPEEELELVELGKLFKQSRPAFRYVFEVYSPEGDLEVRGASYIVAKHYKCSKTAVEKAHKRGAKRGMFAGKKILKYTREGELVYE